MATTIDHAAKLEPFVLLAKSSRGAAAAKAITNAISAVSPRDIKARGVKLMKAAWGLCILRAPRPAFSAGCKLQEVVRYQN